MTQTKKVIWNLLEQAVNDIKKKDDGVSLNVEARQAFNNTFEALYEKIKKDYMKDTVEYLDRHKVASIVIVSILNSNVITYTREIEKNQHFFGEYLIATTVGVIFLQDNLNQLLSEKGYSSISKMKFPETSPSELSYFEVFCRNLYFAAEKSEWGLNPLEIAEKLFLIEYITLVHFGIDVDSFYRQK